MGTGTMELTLNGESYEVASVGGLRYHLPKISERQFCEVWLYAESGWPAICALVNGNSAWLLFLREEGDSGFSTRNPNYNGPKEAVIEYSLSNGQRDEYPAEWNITTPEALHALEHFLETQEMAPVLEWREEHPAPHET
jgi:hypothetical protein